jgi:YD repeat-containing protein
MAFTSPDGVRFDLEWNANFSTSRVRRNGNPYLVIREQTVRSKRQPALHHLVTTTHVPSGVTRKMGFDRNGRLISEDQIEAKTGRRGAPPLRIRRNTSGGIESLVIQGRGRATIGRDPQQRVRTVSQGDEQLRLAYDDPKYPDLPTRMIRDGQDIAEFRYKQGVLQAVVLDLGPKGRVEAEFDAGQVLKVRDTSGFEQTFHYDARSGRLTQLTDSEGGAITWGPEGRLTGATLHGGMRVVAHYAEAEPDELRAIVFYRLKTSK